MAKKVSQAHKDTPPRAPRTAKAVRQTGLVVLVAAAVVGAVSGVRSILSGNQVKERAVELATLPPSAQGSKMLRDKLADAAALVRKNPADMEALAELGRLYHANNYIEQAEKCWRTLHAMQPSEARWSYFLAALRRTSGDYVENLSLLEHTSKFAPDYAPVWLQLGGLALKTGDSDLAEKYYRKRLELLPGDPYACVGLARIHLQRGERQPAQALMESTVKAYPGFPSSHNVYGDILSALGDKAGATREWALGRAAGRFRDAEDPWIDDLRWYCHDFERLRTLATIEFQTDRSDVGVKLIQHAIEVEPGNPSAYELLGKLNLKIGKTEAARDAFEACIRHTSPGHPDAMVYVNLSQVYRTLNRPADTLRVVEDGLRAYPDSYVLHDARGEAIGDAGRFEESVASFKRAIELSPKDGNSHFNLALAYLNLGREAEALEELAISLRDNPNFVPTLTLLSRRALKLGDLVETERYLKPLYELNPSNPEARQMMARWNLLRGRTAAQNGDLKTAEAFYREGVAADPSEAEVHTVLGTLLLEQNRLPEAIEVLEDLHRNKPTDLEGTMLLGQCFARSGKFADAVRVMKEAEVLAKRSGNADAIALCQEVVAQLSKAL